MSATTLMIAQAPGLGGDMIWPLVILAFVLMVMGMLVLLAKRYKRCPSNRVLVIYGKTGKNRAACAGGFG